MSELTLDSAIELLRSLEWVGDLDSCPVCHALQRWHDHEPDCQIGALCAIEQRKAGSDANHSPISSYEWVIKWACRRILDLIRD